MYCTLYEHYTILNISQEISHTGISNFKLDKNFEHPTSQHIVLKHCVGSKEINKRLPDSPSVKQQHLHQENMARFVHKRNPLR